MSLNTTQQSRCRSDISTNAAPRWRPVAAHARVHGAGFRTPVASRLKTPEFKDTSCGSGLLLSDPSLSSAGEDDLMLHTVNEATASGGLMKQEQKRLRSAKCDETIKTSALITCNRNNTCN